MTDNPGYTCGTCRYAGPEFEGWGTMEPRVECRRNHPAIEGFPILPTSSWCWDGSLAYSQRNKEGGAGE